jgi:pyruvyltransferase
VDDVIAQITSCAVIAASSLHGLIVAEAFGIPAMRLPHALTGGDDAAFVDYKFTDYLTALDRPLPVIQQELVGALRTVF